MFQAARDVVKRMELKVGEFATATARPMGNEKEPLDTGEQSEKTTIATAVPRDSGAKILKKLDTAVNDYEKINDIKACKEIIAKNKGTEKQVSNDVNINGSEAQKMATEAVMNALEKAGIPVKMVSAEEAAGMMGEEGNSEFSKKDSDNRRQMKETKGVIDEAISFVTGKDINEVRKDRKQTEKRWKEI